MRRQNNASKKFAIVCSDANGIIVSANSYAVNLFGYSFQEMKGNNVTMLMPRPYKEQHDDYIKRHATSGVTRVIGKSRVVQALRSDGLHIRVKLTLSEVTHNADTMDIEDDTKYIAMFELSEERAAQVWADTNGKILDVNKQYWELFGYNKEELIGKDVTILMQGDHKVNHDNYIKRYLQDPSKPRAVGKVRNVQAIHKYKLQPINVSLQLSHVTSKNYQEREIFSIRDRDLIPDPIGEHKDNEYFLAVLTSVDAIKAVVTTDCKGIIKAASDDFYLLFGYKPEDLLEQPISKLTNADLAIHFPRLSTTRSYRMVILAIHCDKSAFDASIVVEKFVPSESTDGMAVEGDDGFMIRATITRTGNREREARTGKDAINEGEYMGHYTYGKAIGFGYFGHVYVATHRPTGGKVAIKTLRKKQYAIAKMQYPPREVEILEKLSHQHICRLYDTVILHDKQHLILEYIDGNELCFLVENNTIPIDKCRKYWRQLLLAVEYMHSVGCVHRDLKLENIMIDKHDNVKLIDLGFGQYFEPGKKLSTFCGSPDYAAPELFKGRPYEGPPADIWSLGVVLFSLISGFLPFPDTPSICHANYTFPDMIPEGAREIIRSVFKVKASSRASLRQLMEHPWTCETFDGPPVQPKPLIERLDTSILDKINTDFAIANDLVIQDLKNNEHNNVTTLYHLLSANKLEEELTNRIEQEKLLDSKQKENQQQQQEQQQQQQQQQQQKVQSNPHTNTADNNSNSSSSSNIQKAKTTDDMDHSSNSDIAVSAADKQKAKKSHSLTKDDCAIL